MPKQTTRLWTYTKKIVRKGEPPKEYCAISIPPKYYQEFLNKELIVIANGSMLIAVISGCTIPNTIIEANK